MQVKSKLRQDATRYRPCGAARKPGLFGLLSAPAPSATVSGSGSFTLAAGTSGWESLSHSVSIWRLSVCRFLSTFSVFWTGDSSGGGCDTSGRVDSEGSLNPFRQLATPSEFAAAALARLRSAFSAGSSGFWLVCWSPAAAAGLMGGGESFPLYLAITQNAAWLSSNL